MRLIDGDNLIELLKRESDEIIVWGGDSDLYEAGIKQGYDYAIKATKRVPKIPAWTMASNKPDTYFILSMSDYHGLSWWECAECGFNEISNYKYVTKPDYNYCPQCGRKITEFRKRGNLNERKI